ncbi:phospholipid-transporting ATPase 1-like isoform X1 [Nymphaea colorata]|nr:phospholipid-transporting ATPase 1-like isoform X1 [Nymphaea colorata]XP_031485202.1 phospholipid-transporting ATPase 1-like isoform X1 [Nymphaea colorata]XP_031485203.1 phospholipid-transporting ATPase 1-like isoform X1 [Nymphaea colorata]
MNPDQPLLCSDCSTDPSSDTSLSSLRPGSFGCLCRLASHSYSKVASSFSDTEDTFSHFVNSAGSRPRFTSLDSHYFHGSVFGCSSKKVVMETNHSSSEVTKGSFEISGPARYMSHERRASVSGIEKSRSQRIRHKSLEVFEFLSSEENARTIYINDPRKSNDKYEFTGNEIRTSKYTVITFLPKNLFIQFHRLAYLYFLAIAALNQLPPLAVFGRTVSLFPLLFVLFVTAIKDGYEDWRRHRSDRKENNRHADVLQGASFQAKKWKKIQVGEVLRIKEDETIPCDMVLLRTSDPSGVAYVQTMNLDGESNLKTRYARQETTMMDFESDTVSGLIKCEQPNRNIYEFTAAMELGGQKIALGQSNIVLRGCQLKNTDWVVGVAVYAGQETKAMLNSAISPSKRSKLEGNMNRETLWLSVFLLIMCAVVAGGMGLWLGNHKSKLDTVPYYRKRYFNSGANDGKNYKYYGLPLEIFFSFLSSIIVFQIMIPISLYISMELVRLGQSYFMIGDTQMYDADSNSRFQCRSLNINEDLGQVRYIFSDKTGTLTENKMDFCKASIYGKNYGNAAYALDCSTDDASDVLVHKTDITEVKEGRSWKTKIKVKVDHELVSLLHKDLVGKEREVAHEYFLTLAACNTVIPVITQSPAPTNSATSECPVLDYQGESPDEQALVSAASAYGYTLIERTSGHIVIDVHGEKLRLDVLGLHEFDSVRKRMSVIVRFADGSVKVLVKGADNSIFSILSKASDMVDPGGPSHDIKNSTQNHLNEYSSLGLRTLVIAAKNITEAELEEWQQTYAEASTSLNDRVAKLRKTAALIESNLNLLGATGIEDKLQEGVPETIEALREAGLKVWVLTGDKQETAISIGLSCKLLTLDMQQVIINGNSEEECRRLLADVKNKYGIKTVDQKDATKKIIKNGDNKDDGSSLSSNNFPGSGLQASKCINKTGCHSQQPSGKATGMKNTPLALIIDGTSLVHILAKDLENELFDIAISCKVVLCCRVAPLQKAGVVDLIKSRTNDMTLAIGDGANDVSMIQMADVGVGISGQEGRQAVMASDFAMGQFRFLKRLLLVHGHWNYHRIGYLVLYNFYRNAVFVLMLFWYILCTAFSTTSALTDWSSVFYSVIYTSVPTIVVGIFDKDLSHRTLLEYPKLYMAGHRQESYNLHLFWLTMIDTLWQSLVLFYVPLLTYSNGPVDIWSIGSLWTISVVVLVNVHLAMDVHRWVLFIHLATWGSIVITYICLVILDSIPRYPNYWTIYHLATSPTYWLTIFLVTILALLPRFLLKILQQMFWPSDIQIAREAEKFGKLSYHSSKPKQGVE